MSDFDARAQEWDTPERQDLARGLAAVIGGPRAAGRVHLETRTATEIERDGRAYPLFLLTGRQGLGRRDVVRHRWV